MENLEVEKFRIEREREMLMMEKNKETEEWKQKYEDIKDEHQDIMNNLKEANKCYLMQVNENEELREQLKVMSEQHKFMMKKFEDFEKKLQN